DRGVRKSSGARVYPDGRRVDYKTGMTTLVTGRSEPPLVSLEAQLHPRFLTLAEREQIADLVGQGVSLRQIGRVLGRAASTIKRELDRRSGEGGYRPYRAHRGWAVSRARPKPS